MAHTRKAIIASPLYHCDFIKRRGCSSSCYRSKGGVLEHEHRNWLEVCVTLVFGDGPQCGWELTESGGLFSACISNAGQADIGISERLCLSFWYSQTIFSERAARGGGFDLRSTMITVTSNWWSGPTGQWWWPAATCTTSANREDGQLKRTELKLSWIEKVWDTKTKIPKTLAASNSLRAYSSTKYILCKRWNLLSTCI